jgi:hypothetical protein
LIFFFIEVGKRDTYHSLFFLVVIFDLPGLDLGLVYFFPLAHEVPEDSHLIIVVLVEVETISMSEPDLEEVVVQTLL